jgi:Zinc knuckle
VSQTALSLLIQKLFYFVILFSIEYQLHSPVILIIRAAVRGTCYICGKKGHMANKCPNRESKNADKKRTSKKCLNCNKKGHLAKDCWFKESNKDKRPPAFVVKSNKDESGEKAAAMIDDVNNLQEYLLGTMDNSDVINDQNLWIADLAATVHMTPY